MKVIAAVAADFQRSPIGLPSRLNDDLLGETVLRRTLRRVLAAKRVNSVHLVVEAGQQPLARAAAADLDVRVETHDAPPVPWGEYVACARKWSLDAWRGGIGGITVFDEFLHPWVFAALAQRERADALVAVPPAAPLLDPRLLDELIEYLHGQDESVRMGFTQSAPGLSAVVFAPALLEDFAALGQPLGRALAYNPNQPQRDITMQPSFFNTDSLIMHGVGRCLADTDAAMASLTAILRVCPADDSSNHVPDASAVSRWLAEHQYDRVGSLPQEVEIELTTEDPLGQSTLRPRGEAAGRRGPMAPALFERLIDELARRDDVRVVLGGFGDPLLHPRFGAFVAHCRRAGIFALAVRTAAVQLDESAVNVLFEQKVDVLNVPLDAVSAEAYRRLHQVDYYDRVLANLERVFARQRLGRQPQPLVVCEMLKTPETMSELEAFYDLWMLKAGAAVLAGPSHYAGQWPDHAVMPMAPPMRRPCRRLFERIMVLADGSVTACAQDFRGLHAIGALDQNTLSELWAGEAMNAVRQSHLAGRYDGTPLCPRCAEWHRP